MIGRKEEAENARKKAVHDDAEFDRLNVEATNISNRIELLDADSDQVKATLPALSLALTARASQIATKKKLEAEAAIRPILNDLAGLLRGDVPTALDTLIELDIFQTELSAIGGQPTAQKIVAEIVGEHAATTAPAIAGGINIGAA